MEDGSKDAVRLSEDQRRLVRDNIGLVGVHLRRYVTNISTPRRDREWEDLFQEGCLGLIQAAIRHRPERGIAFAAFALPRIHNAVSKALSRRFSTVYIPPKRSNPTDRATSARQTPIGESTMPKVYSLSDEQASSWTARHGHDARHDPLCTGTETVGARLRTKYEEAVRRAGAILSNQTSTRGDRDKLVRVLIEERFLIPHEEARSPLRRLARDTRSSYARVAQCDKQLSRAIGDELQSDPEFRALEHWRKTDELGPDLPIDADRERELTRLRAAEFIRRFRTTDGIDRTALLANLIQAVGGDLDAIILAHFKQLPRSAQEKLLRDVCHCS